MAYVKDPMSTTGLARSGATSMQLPNTANGPAGPNAPPGQAAGGQPAAPPKPTLQPGGAPPMTGQALAGQPAPGVQGFAGRPAPVIYKPGEGPVVNSQNIPAPAPIKASPITPQPGQQQQMGQAPPRNLQMFMAGKQASLMDLTEEPDVIPRIGKYTADGEEANINYGRKGPGWLSGAKPAKTEKKADGWFGGDSMLSSWLQNRKLEQQTQQNNLKHPGPKPSEAVNQAHQPVIDPTLQPGKSTLQQMGDNAGRMGIAPVATVAGALGTGLSGLGYGTARGWNDLGLPKSMQVPYLEAGLGNAFQQSRKLTSNALGDAAGALNLNVDGDVNRHADSRVWGQLKDLRDNPDLDPTSRSIAHTGAGVGYAANEAAQMIANPGKAPAYLAKAPVIGKLLAGAGKLPGVAKAAPYIPGAMRSIPAALSGVDMAQQVMSPGAGQQSAPPSATPPKPVPPSVVTPPTPPTPTPPPEPASPGMSVNPIPSGAGAAPANQAPAAPSNMAPPTGPGTIGRHAPQIKSLQDAIDRQKARLATMDPNSYQGRSLAKQLDGMGRLMRDTEREQTYGAQDYKQQGFSQQAIDRWQEPGGAKSQYETAARQFGGQNPQFVQQGQPQPNSVAMRPSTPQHTSMLQMPNFKRPSTVAGAPPAKPTAPTPVAGAPPARPAAPLPQQSAKVMKPPLAPKMAELDEDLRKCAAANFPQAPELSDFAFGFYIHCVEKGASADGIREAIQRVSGIDAELGQELAPLLSEHCPLLPMREKYAVNYGALAGGAKQLGMKALQWGKSLVRPAAGVADDAARAVPGAAPAATGAATRATSAAGGAPPLRPPGGPAGGGPPPVPPPGPSPASPMPGSPPLPAGTPGAPRARGFGPKDWMHPAARELYNTGSGGLIGYGVGETINAGANWMGLDESVPGMQYLPYLTAALGAGSNSRHLGRMARNIPGGRTAMGAVGNVLAGGSAPNRGVTLGKGTGDTLNRASQSLAGYSMLTGENFFKPQQAMDNMANKQLDRVLQQNFNMSAEDLKHNPVMRAYQAYQQGGMGNMLQSAWGDLTPEQKTGLISAIGGPLAGGALAMAGQPGLGAMVGLGGLGAGAAGMYAGGGNPLHGAANQYGAQVPQMMEYIDQQAPGIFGQLRQLPRSQQADYFHEIMQQFGAQRAGQELQRSQGQAAPAA